MGRLMDRDPTLHDVVRLMLLGVVVGAGMAGGTYALVAVLFALAYFAARGAHWLSQGYVKQSELGEAWERALQKPSINPDKPSAYPGWSTWAYNSYKKINSDADPLPGNREDGIYSFLMGQSDDEEMEAELNNRIWPRKHYCDCERQIEKPWTFLHSRECPDSPEYQTWMDEQEALEEERRQQSCSCIKKKRRGKTKVYRVRSCSIHGWSEEEEDFAKADAEMVTAIEDAANDLLAAQRVPPVNLSHPLGPPTITGATQRENELRAWMEETYCTCEFAEYIVNMADRKRVRVDSPYCPIHGANPIAGF